MKLWEEGMTLQDIADAGLLKPRTLTFPLRPKCHKCWHYCDAKSLFKDFCKCVCHEKEKLL
jgi:hypothetical protein